MASFPNALLGTLSRTDRGLFVEACETVPFEFGQVLAEQGSRARFAYFPTTGFLSQIQIIDGEAGLEIGMVGREGMVGAQLILGMIAEPARIVVQGRGEGLRIQGKALNRLVNEMPKLKQTLDRYLQVRMVQLSRSAACSSFHQIQPRLARWLLMTHDRADADEFNMTQELLAHMLGVRREGVTAAAGIMQASGFIRYRRGLVQVLNRQGLETAACSCYEADRQSALEILRRPRIGI